ncbi:putative zinc-binding protein [Verrucomicrobiota bacterium]
MVKGNENTCCDDPKLIFACSGSSDVGAVADRAARKLAHDGAGKMFCLTGIGGRIKGIMETTKSASKILVIDGCPMGCGKSCLTHAGIEEFEHMQVTDLGLKKGNTSVTEDAIERVVTEAGRKLHKEVSV